VGPRWAKRLARSWWLRFPTITLGQMIAGFGPRGGTAGWGKRTRIEPRDAPRNRRKHLVKSRNWTAAGLQDLLESDQGATVEDRNWSTDWISLYIGRKIQEG